MSRELMAWNASQGARNFPNWKEGDKVWLDARNLKQGRPSQKLSDKKLGPFTIKRVITDALFEFQLPKSMKVHPVFNMVYLTKAHDDPIPGCQHVPAAPIIVEGEEEYKVEEILNSRMFRRQLQYLVKWKGYSTLHNSWEPAKNIANAQSQVRKFHAAHPNAPRTLSATIFSELPWTTIENFTANEDVGSSEGVMSHNP
jgi:hypothetical protein